MIPVKICGLTRIEDALEAWVLGASALGLVFHPGSPRCLSVQEAKDIRRHLPSEAFCVGVFVDMEPARIEAIAEEVNLGALQLHGRETPDHCAQLVRPIIKAIRSEDEPLLDAYPVAAFLLDALHPTLAGGTGLQSDWNLAARLARQRRLILAGGLRPDNVAEAAERVSPWGLDVSSGVESAPGIKDPLLMKSFLNRINPTGTRPCLIPR